MQHTNSLAFSLLHNHVQSMRRIAVCKRAVDNRLLLAYLEAGLRSSCIVTNMEAMTRTENHKNTQLREKEALSNYGPLKIRKSRQVVSPTNNPLINSYT